MSKKLLVKTLLRKKVMLFLLEFPALLLLLRPNIIRIIILGFMYVICCLIMKYKSLTQILCRNVRIFPLSFLLGGLAGYDFYTKWMPSSKLAFLASIIDMSTPHFLLLVVICLVILAVPGISFIISFLFEENKVIVFNHVNKINSFIFLKSEYVLCAMIAFFVAMQFSLRPFTTGNPEIDSSVFLYIGKMMHEGYVPYRDLFDHKGPVLYFIQYVGLFINSDIFWGVGVWLLEVCNMFVFIVAILKVAKLLTDSRATQYISIWVIPVLCGRFLYQGGNFTEEYALPWIAISLYIFLRYIILGIYRSYDIIWIGISFSVVLFLRANMIAVWITFMPIVFLTMIFKKKWQELLKCSFFFFIGCCVIVLPILFYCIFTNSLNEMVEYYFKFNLSYSGSEGNVLNRINAMFVLAYQTQFALPALLITFKNYYKQKVYVFNCIFFMVSLLLAGISGRSFQHYGMVLLPAIVLFEVYFVQMLERTIKVFVQKTKAYEKWKNYFSMTSFLLIFFVVSAIYTMCIVSFSVSFERVQYPVTQYIVSNTSKDEDVLIIGNWCSNYLVADRSTKNKFFYQAPPINISNELAAEFVKELKVHPSNTIVVTYNKAEILNGDSNISKICNYLEEQAQKGVYTCKVYEDYFVYQLN